MNFSSTRLTFAALTLAPGLMFLASAHADDFLGTRVSYFDSHQYYFDLSAKRLAAATAWNDGADFPPLPPLKARDIAIAEAKKLVPSVKSWSADKITLEHIHQTYGSMPTFWIYLVSCEDEDGPYFGPGRVLTIPLMMDGTVIPPKVKRVR